MIEDFLDENGDKALAAIVVAVGIVLLYLIVARLLRGIVNRIAEEGGDSAARAETLWAMLRRVLLIVFIAIGALTVAVVVGIPITPLLAVGSAVGVAVGFGAQDLVRDIIAGFFILAEDQYHIGDVIRVAGVAGAVEDIRLRVTVLRDLDGYVHYVPNGQIQVTTNLTQQFSQVVIDVGVAYKVDVDRAIDVFGDELRRLAADDEWSNMIIEEPQILGVDALGDSAVVLRGVLKVGADDRWLVKRETLRRVKNRFDAEGIEIPYPHLTLYQGDSTSGDG
ncbi:MAG: mechanosensitive ion channel family protein [Acidimicrobiia bacterium]|nr:mechanosensitive ion channel family protein [Acidimicrobiia bacterium]